jgi:hypothetical protein
VGLSILAAILSAGCRDAAAPPPAPGGIRVSVTTTGGDPDANGYLVSLNAGPERSIGGGATVTFDNLYHGEHTLLVLDVARHCTIEGDNPRRVAVIAGAITAVAIAIHCPLTRLQVQVMSGGAPETTAQYRLSVTGPSIDTMATLSPSSALTIPRLAAGDYRVALSVVPVNCDIVGSNQRIVHINSGETLQSSFDVLCVGAERIVVLVPYGATGYRYKAVDWSTPNGDFERLTFDDSRAESGFSTGSAPFGSQFGSSQVCPLDRTARTSWPEEGDLLLRKTFVLPEGVTNVKISVAIDDYVKVFVNGLDITASAGWRPLDEGFVTYWAGCPVLNSLVFKIPDSALNPGTNLVAVRARDMGDWNYADLQISGQH